MLPIHQVVPEISQPLSLYCLWMSQSAGGSQRDVVHLGWPIASSYMSPNAGVGVELRGLSQKVQLCTAHGAQKTLEIYINSIFKQLYLRAFNVLEINFTTCWAFLSYFFTPLCNRNKADRTAPLPVSWLDWRRKEPNFNPVTREEWRDPGCAALQRQNTENLKQIFPEKELSGYSPNSYIHVSVSDLYITLIGLPILLQENRLTERWNI